MSEPFSMAGKLPRRRFLGTAAVTAFAVGTSTPPRKATAAVIGVLSVAFWDGTSLVPVSGRSSARSLAVGRPVEAPEGMTGKVKVTVNAPTCTNAYGAGASAAALQAVNAYFSTTAEKTASDGLLPFYAWTTAPQGRPAISFPMPLDGAGGITLSVESGSGETPCRFSSNGENGAIPLREGTYVVAVGYNPSWLLCSFDPSKDSKAPVTQRTLRGFAPVSFDYVLVTLFPVKENAALTIAD